MWTPSSSREDQIIRFIIKRTHIGHIEAHREGERDLRLGAGLVVVGGSSLATHRREDLCGKEEGEAGREGSGKGQQHSSTHHIDLGKHARRRRRGSRSRVEMHAGVFGNKEKSTGAPFNLLLVSLTRCGHSMCTVSSSSGDPEKE